MPPPSLHLRLRDEASATRVLRQAVDRVAGERGLPAADSFDLKVAATEALTNALRGAPDGYEVDVTVSARDESVDVELRDRGRFKPRIGADPERGRGIPLMLALVDEVEFAVSGLGTRVRMRKRVGTAGEGGPPAF